MSVLTAGDLVRGALKDAGPLAVGQSSLGEDLNDAFDRMNMMIAQWNRRRWLIYVLDTLSLTSTGAESYTVGAGGDFDITSRPSLLESAYFRQTYINPDPPDYPLQVIYAREDYNRIRLKSLGAFPQYCYYETTYPLGNFYPWPIGGADLYEYFLTVRHPLSQFTSLSETIDLPQEYKAAIQYNLAVRLRPLFQLPPDPTLIALATDALNVLKTDNAQIPLLRMPDDLVSSGSYDVYSDRGNG